MALKTKQQTKADKVKAAEQAKTEAKPPREKAKEKKSTAEKMVKVTLLHSRVVQLPKGSLRRYANQKRGEVVEVPESEAQRLIAKRRATLHKGK